MFGELCVSSSAVCPVGDCFLSTFNFQISDYIPMMSNSSL